MGVKPIGLKIDAIIAEAKEKKKQGLYAHYGNTAILFLMLVLLCLFFYYLFPFKTPLARTGVYLMTGGLAVRILIEVFSTMKSMKIDLSDTTLATSSSAMSFYTFRKRIHGPVTLIIVAAYIVGFFMLSPEYSNYMPMPWLIFMDASAVVLAIVLILVIRKGIRKELEDLRHIVELRKQLAD